MPHLPATAAPWLAPLQPILAQMLAGVLSRHPDITTRLAGYDGRVVAIAPTDLPFALLLDLAGPDTALRACRRSETAGADAIISGDLATLSALAEGRVDGDALFFSRQLRVEGDTEVVVALRNAIDGAGLDLAADLTARLGPLAPMAERAARQVLSLAGALRARAQAARDSLIAPALRALAARDARLDQIETELGQIRRANRGRRAAP